jgi:hypothetical protein
MLSSDDHQLKKMVEVENLRGGNSDETIWNIQKWVVRNIKYIGDNLSQGTIEYWQFPFETLAIRMGDCEDGSLLIAGLAINAGIPAFRVRMVAGNVQPNPGAPQGGHAYVSYLRESDNQWVAVDWCYAEDSTMPVADKKALKQNPIYKDVWFSFNHMFSWSNKAENFSSF